MSTEPIPAPNVPTEDDLLLPLEKQNFPAEYREYYALKRNNFFATIQRFRDQWHYYMMLDQIWMQEFRSLNPATDPNTIFPKAIMRPGCLILTATILRSSIKASRRQNIVHQGGTTSYWLNTSRSRSSLTPYTERSKN